MSSQKSTLPENILAWQMFGAGFEKFGKNEEPSVLPMPQITEDELLVKIDAIGLCFSDVKLIRAGEEHPRVYVKDLSKEPVIPGHEAVMTVVKVGSKLEGKFKVGARYIIQADIYVKGVGWAYGYAIDGGMAQYSIINQKVLNGDEGCYLLPIADSMPSGVAALLEPWTCVLASYRISHRNAPMDGGKMLFVFGKAASSVKYQLGKTVSKSAPTVIDVVNSTSEFISELKSTFPKAKISQITEICENAAYDDVFLCGCTKAEGETASKRCANNACISFVGEFKEDWMFDVGSIHYKGWFYQGTKGTDLSAAYGRNLRSAVKKGGSCWLPGGAGAMGQMHSQLAVDSEDGPSRVLVSDMDNVRIEHVKKLLGPIAAKRGIELKFLNPASFATPAEFDAEVTKFAPEGFDDIIMLVPVPALVAGSAKHLKADGLMNIFAGIPAGKEASLPADGIASNGFRFIGSSGSKTEDLRNTIKMVESGRLNPVTALAAVGGMMSLKKGLEAVANAAFPGKTVIFPNCKDMPLTPVAEIAKLAPGIEKTLAPDGSYTKNTEETLLKKYLA